MAKPVRIAQDQLDNIAENIAPLEERHRAAMLHLILTWGTLDGALGMLLSTMEDLPYSHGADMYGDLPSSTKFARMRQVLKRSSAPAAANASKKLKSYKKTYERCSDIRNFIAHSHCPGIWTIDRDIILFARGSPQSPAEKGPNPFRRSRSGGSWPAVLRC